MWHSKKVMSLIAHCLCVEQRAPAQMPGGRWPHKPVLYQLASSEGLSRYGEHSKWLGRKIPAKSETRQAPLQEAVLGATCRTSQTSSLADDSSMGLSSVLASSFLTIMDQLHLPSLSICARIRIVPENHLQMHAESFHLWCTPSAV